MSAESVGESAEGLVDGATWDWDDYLALVLWTMKY